jgi:hypothetical protein
MYPLKGWKRNLFFFEVSVFEQVLTSIVLLEFFKSPGTGGNIQTTNKARISFQDDPCGGGNERKKRKKRSYNVLTN